MSDTPEKVEGAEATETTATTEGAKSAKKGVDINGLVNKGKDGAGKACGFITKLFAEEPEKGMTYAMYLPVLFGVLGLASGNFVLILLNLVLAVIGFIGVKSLKDKLFPKEAEAPKAE